MTIKNWKFNITDNGTFVWQAISKNGEILGQSSQNFKSRNGARYNADLMGRSGKYSQKLEWNLIQNNDISWSWKANNIVNKENVAASHKTFENKLDAVQNAVIFGYKGDLVSNIENIKPIDDAQKTAFASTKNQSTKATNQNPPVISKSIYVEKHENLDLLRWLKWLLLIPLILALLFWLLPLLVKKLNSQQSTDNKSTSSISSSRTQGIIGSLQKLSFDKLQTNLEKSKILDSIDKSTPLTLLAPTNSAFESLPPETLASLEKPENIEQMQNLLKNHFFSGNLDLSSLRDGSTIKSLAGADLPVKFIGEKLFIGNVEVDKTIDENSNGFSVYAINKILTTTDVKANILLDSITPPTVSTSSGSKDNSGAENKSEPTYRNGGNLDILNKDGGFTLFLATINASGLKDSLETDGPTTLFAPTDDAMKSIQPSIDELLKPENRDRLQSFIKDHTVSSKITFQHFINSTVVTTLSNQPITLNTNTKGGYAQAISSKNASLAPIDDILTNNGVLQVLTSNPI
ncbi:MAG: fasciclin domain-containing protein [candidate division SR1 bacterium]|nr:fasciclin domain-containing protein [candidate division SR1 bacterium]